MNKKTNQVIIKFSDDINVKGVADTLGKHYLIDNDISELPYKTKIIDVEKADLENLIKQLEADPSIEYM